MAAHLSVPRLLAFSMPSLATGMLERPALYILPFIYGRYFGIDLATIGTILFAARIFDFLTDPLTGYLSDMTRTRWGRRKPWLLPGALITMLSVYYLFIPPDNVSATYFALWYFAMYFGWTMIEIPMASWMSDLAHDYEGRSRVVTWRTTFQYGGLFLFALIPLTPILMPSLGLLEGTEIDPAAMRAIAMLVIVLLPLGVILAMAFVPQGSYLESHSERISFKEILLSLVRNKPARLFYFSHTINAVATGLLHAVYLFWADNHLGLGEDVPWILLTISTTNIIGIAIWHRVMLRLQRYQVWAFGGTLSALLIFTMAFISPGESAFQAVLLVSGGYGILIASTYIAAPSVLADLIDYDTLKTGHNKAANYFAAYYWLQKINIAFGGAFAFWLLDWFGFQAEATEQTAAGSLALILDLSILPGLLFVIAAVVMWFFPLNRRRQDIVRKRLETRPVAVTQ